MNTLSKKHIILAISGGIAAYKSCLLLRELQKKGAQVTVVMTENAKKFITPLTLETLSDNRVYSDTFSTEDNKDIEHIALAKKGDILVVAPATANVIGKFTHGIADDLLSTIFLAFTSPVVIAPAMNTNMYKNIAVQENISLLKKRKINFVDPGYGKLACGDEGPGRMAEIDQILLKIDELCKDTDKKLKGKKLLITAGPTREPIDPVRFISNRSSGKMGYALAKAAKKMGGEVVLISGPTSLPSPEGVSYIDINTSEEMRNKVLGNISDADIVIMCAAVSDFCPETTSPQKIKKNNAETINLSMKKSTDILSEITKKPGQLIIGFAAETENLIENAKGKLQKKNLDLIVANYVGDSKSGFEVDENAVTMIDKSLKITEIPIMPKKELAFKIIDKILSLKHL